MGTDAKTVSFQIMEKPAKVQQLGGTPPPPLFCPSPEAMRMGCRSRPPQVRDRARDGDSGSGELGAEEQGLLFSPEGPGFISQIDYGFMCGCVCARARWALLAFS